MSSTSVNYRIYSQDISKGLGRVAAQPAVRREAAYYADKIGKVASVEAFLGDHRLYAYAMKAYGLEEMIYAKGFMKKVLQSDLSDAGSFVNRLTDRRYRDFALAFSFQADGTVLSGIAAQDAQQEGDTVGLYTARTARVSTVVAEETAYADAVLPRVRSVDELLADGRARSYLVAAFELDPTYTTGRLLRQILTSDLSDPASFANASGDARYIALAGAFGFATDGSVPAGEAPLTSAQLDGVKQRYAATANGGVNSTRAAMLRNHYEARIGSVRSVDELVGDPDLLRTVLVAFGFAGPGDSHLLGAETLRRIFASDLSDPGSPANIILPEASRAMIRAFNFERDGTVPAGQAAQSEDALRTTIESFLRSYGEADPFETNHFKAQIDSIKTVDALLNDSRLHAYLVAAYDLKGTSADREVMARALRSDPSDPDGWLHQQPDPQLIELAWDFNFDASGKIAPRRLAQSPGEVTATLNAYRAAAATDAASQSAAAREAEYYRKTIFTIRSVNEFVKDRRLVDVVLRAHNVPADQLVAGDRLKRILTSGLGDLGSFAVTSGDARLRTLASSFNFAADGGLEREAAGRAQSTRALRETQERYLQQRMEVEAGQQDEGVRLALYFRRMAPRIKSAYDLLADKALLAVAMTALGIPEAASRGNVDALARMITRKLKVEDLQNPKKLEGFITTFTTLYELRERGLASSPALTLFGRQAGRGIL